MSKDYQKLLSSFTVPYRITAHSNVTVEQLANSIYLQLNRWQVTPAALPQNHPMDLQHGKWNIFCPETTEGTTPPVSTSQFVFPLAGESRFVHRADFLHSTSWCPWKQSPSFGSQDSEQQVPKGDTGWENSWRSRCVSPGDPGSEQNTTRWSNRDTTTLPPAESLVRRIWHSQNPVAHHQHQLSSPSPGLQMMIHTCTPSHPSVTVDSLKNPDFWFTHGLETPAPWIFHYNRTKQVLQYLQVPKFYRF